MSHLRHLKQRRAAAARLARNASGPAVRRAMLAEIDRLTREIIREQTARRRNRAARIAWTVDHFIGG